MTEKSFSDPHIAVFSQTHPKAAAALGKVLVDWGKAGVLLQPNSVDIKQYNSCVVVTYGENDAEIEKMIQGYPLLRICTGKETDKTGTVVLFAPVKIDEILYEISNMLDINLKSQTALVTLGNYVLNKKTRVLSGKQFNDTSLTEKEAAVILYLYNSMQTGNEPIGREELLKEVWKYAEGIDTHTIETHIYRLRQKIDKNKAGKGASDLILTVEGGYCLDM